MTSLGRITVLVEADAFARLQDAISVARAALGPGAPIHARVPESLLEDVARSSGGWDGVRLVPSGATVDVVRSGVRTPYVLVLPPSNPMVLTGVAAAAAILNGDSAVGEVGGLVLAAPHSVVSGALVEVDRGEDGSMALAPVEAMDPPWSAVGGAAVTPVMLLGGLTLVRAERLTGGHLHVGSVVARALATLGPDGQASRLLLSEFALVTREGADVVFADSGVVERLPDDALAAWSARGIREIRVLHRGVAIRDDDARCVVVIADNRIAAVDDRGDRRPEDPSAYYASKSTRRQLGPVFEVLHRLLRSLRPTVSSPDAVLHPTTLELQLLVLARRIVARLPGPLLVLGKRLVRSVGRP